MNAAAAINLDGRVVIVTGGNRGIGKAMALGLLEARARVLLVGRDGPSVLATTETAGHAYGPDRVAGITCDIRGPDAGWRVVDAALKVFGDVHVLVNNAALGQRYIHDSPTTITTRFWQSDPERIRDVVDVNVTAPFLLARAVTPHLVAQGWGRIVNITTSLDTMQSPLNSPYGPSKAALDTATLIWSKELAETGVTVNSLLPGHPVDTGMIFLAKGPLLAPEVMVPPVVWLASTHSSGVTGGRFVANRWHAELPPDEAAQLAREDPVLRQPLHG